MLRITDMGLSNKISNIYIAILGYICYTHSINI